MSPVTRPNDDQLDSSIATDVEVSTAIAAHVTAYHGGGGGGGPDPGHYHQHHARAGYREPLADLPDGYPTGWRVWDSASKTTLYAEISLSWSEDRLTLTATWDTYNDAGVQQSRVVDVTTYDSTGNPVSATTTTPIGPGGFVP